MFKTAEDVQIGDVIIYEAFGGERRTVKVNFVSQDIKNGRAGFDGVTVDGNESVWGYCSQIVKYVSHAEKVTN
jgi:hypothetical protein